MPPLDRVPAAQPAFGSPSYDLANLGSVTPVWFIVEGR
jgi:hypothetical protein